MFSILFTVYLIACVVFSGILITLFCVHNILPKSLYKWMMIFFPATLLVGLCGLIGFSVSYFTTRGG